MKLSSLRQVLEAESESEAVAALLKGSDVVDGRDNDNSGTKMRSEAEGISEALCSEGNSSGVSTLSEEEQVLVNHLRPEDWLKALQECSSESAVDWRAVLNSVGKPLLVRIKEAAETQYLTATYEQTTILDGAVESWQDVKFSALAQATPLRLTYSEREILRLLESALEISDYTGVVDVIGNDGPRGIVKQIRQFCAVLSGLVVARDYEEGQKMLRDRDFKQNELFFQTTFEIGRRYKLLNPERMRDSYGKLVYLLMDSQNPHILGLLDFDCVCPVRSVYSFLKSKQNGLALLDDPLMRLATRQIFDNEKTRYQIDQEVYVKNTAVKQLIEKYATEKTEPQLMMRRRGILSHLKALVYNDSTTDTDRLDIVHSKYDREILSQEDVETAIYSLSDHMSFLRYNQLPCDKMIEYLKEYFDPADAEEPEFSLAIQAGRSGARLTHAHKRQYQYVLQTLTLWRQVLNNFMKLWFLADKDMLDSNNRYQLCDTGQGLQRLQRCPQIAAEMSRIVSQVQHIVGSWAGSAAVHLGDHNVPNALTFIDKYTQVPRILSPIVLCLDKIPHLRRTPELKVLVDKLYGGEQNLKKVILTDFFRHAFDGSGGDNFFDAGSCIDGRLTSAWNWCSQIEKKSYFPIFQLTGFTGFDGKF